MTIPCIKTMQGNSKMIPKLVFLLRQQQLKLKEICSFLDFLHFDVLGLSHSTPNPEVGVLEAIYEMKRLINIQQEKIDMLRAKARAKARVKAIELERPVEEKLYWLFITLFLLVILRIIYLLPSQDVINFQATKMISQLEITLRQEETIESQAQMIAFLQEELRKTREFYWFMSKLVFGMVSIGLGVGLYVLSGLQNKIRVQGKIIVDQIYEELIRSDTHSKSSQSFSLLFLSGITFVVVVAELYLVSTLF